LGITTGHKSFAMNHEENVYEQSTHTDVSVKVELVCVYT